jgi:hypothetical protein
LDFTSFEDKEGLGSLYDRHRERVRSVDKLVEKWEGTGQGPAKGRGKDRGQFDKSPINRGKVLIWESIASGIRTGDSILTRLSSSQCPPATD